MLDRLKQMCTYARGTISENRLLDALIIKKAELQKTVTIRIYMLNEKIYNHKFTIHIYVAIYLGIKKSMFVFIYLFIYLFISSL